MENILKIIGVDYILGMFDLKGADPESIITRDLIKRAENIVDDNFNEYLKSNDEEELIKKTGLHYFIAIYLMGKFGAPNNINGGSIKSKLREFITEKNDISHLHKSLQNFDFYLGSCGIEAEKINSPIF